MNKTQTSGIIQKLTSWNWKFKKSKKQQAQLLFKKFSLKEQEMLNQYDYGTKGH